MSFCGEDIDRPLENQTENDFSLDFQTAWSILIKQAGG